MTAAAAAGRSVQPSASPDLDLALRHRYGDRTAFDEIYERYAGMVYNLAYRLARNPARAEDYTQEIFLRIFRHLGRFSGRSTLKTWVYRVAVNHCRSRLSRKRLFTKPLADEVGGEEGVDVEDPGRGPESRALAGDAGRRIKKALDDVKPVFREAVILRDLEELTYDEIAEVLGVKIGTVRSRIARGREQLRLALEEAARQDTGGAGDTANDSGEQR